MAVGTQAAEVAAAGPEGQPVAAVRLAEAGRQPQAVLQPEAAAAVAAGPKPRVAQRPAAVGAGAGRKPQAVLPRVEAPQAEAEEEAVAVRQVAAAQQEEWPPPPAAAWVAARGVHAPGEVEEHELQRLLLAVERANLAFCREHGRAADEHTHGILVCAGTGRGNVDSRVDDAAALGGLVGRGEQVEVVDVAGRVVRVGDRVVNPACGWRAGHFCGVLRF